MSKPIDNDAEYDRREALLREHEERESEEFKADLGRRALLDVGGEVLKGVAAIFNK